MAPIKTPLDLYKHLPKTNCGDCGVSSCLAFAASVIKAEKRLTDCPHLDREAINDLEGRISRPVNLENIREEQLKELKKKVRAIDIGSRAELLGAANNGNSITIPCLGKDFTIDQAGTVASQCHTHAWFSLPLLDYILHSRGKDISGKWVPFRELENGKTWNPLFEQRCEKPLKRIADSYQDLFGDLVTMFGGSSSYNAFDADIDVVLFPFPKVPVLICYWKPEEDGMPSKLHLFFDETAEENLSIESLFTLGTGMVRMFEKMVNTHRSGKSALD